MADDIVSRLAKATVQRNLLQSRGLMADLMKSCLPSEEQVEALLGQVTLAKERNQTAWRKRVATDANCLQFHSRQWISNHIFRLPQKKAQAVQKASSPSRDIRLKTDPNLELVSADMGQAASASQGSPVSAEPVLQEQMDVDDTIREIEEVMKYIPTSWSEQVGEELPFGEVLEQPQAPAAVSEKPQHAAAASLKQNLPTPTMESQLPAATQTTRRDVTPPPSQKAPEQELRRSPRKHTSSRRGVEHEPIKTHAPRLASPLRGKSGRRQQGRRRSPAPSNRAAEKRRGSPVRSQDRSRVHDQKRTRSDHPRDYHRGPRSYAEVATKGTLHQMPREARSAVAPSASSRAGLAPSALSRAGKAPPALSGASSAPLATSKAGSVVLCPISGCGQAVSKNHAFDQHLPGILNTQKLTESVTTRRISALKLCGKWILGYPEVEPLVQYVNALHAFHPKEITISKSTVDSAKAVCELQGYQIPPVFYYAPINSPGMLVHWKIALQVLSCLEEKNRTNLRDLFPAIEEVVSEDCPEAFDSHFHLDRTAQRARRPIRDIVGICASIKPDDEFQVRVTGGVTVFCDPDTYPSEEQVAECRRHGMIVAIGLHPKTIPSDDDWRQFGKCMGYSGVSALGEVGLDYSVPARRWSQQHVVLNRALQLLRPDLVLVLHSRSQKELYDGSATQLLYQLKGVVPKDRGSTSTASAETKTQWIDG